MAGTVPSERQEGLVQEKGQHEQHLKPSSIDVSYNTNGASAAEAAEVPRGRRGFFKSIRAFVWDDPDKSEYERKFLRKLDFFLLTYTCLGYFVCRPLPCILISPMRKAQYQESGTPTLFKLCH
jgi:hypothetical protein